MSDQARMTSVAAEALLGERHPHGGDCRVVTYDFRRPDKLSKEQIRTIQIISETFANIAALSLSQATRGLWEIGCVLVDQLTFEEGMSVLPAPNLMAAVGMDPIKSNICVQVDPPVAEAVIERLLGGEGKPRGGEPRDITDLEYCVFEPVFARLAAAFGEAWQPVLPELKPALRAIETNPRFMQIVPPSEMCALIEFNMKSAGAEGKLRILMPWLSLEPIIHRLTAQWLYSPKGTKAVPAMERRASALKGRLAVVADAEALSLEELRALRKGSLVRVPGLDTGACSLRSGEVRILGLELDARSKSRSGRLSFKVTDLPGEAEARGAGPAEGRDESLAALMKGLEALGSSMKESLASLRSELVSLSSRQEDLADQVIYGGAEDQSRRPPEKPFEALAGYSGEDMALFLASESPQATAFVLSNLPPEVSARVLACLPEEQQPEVMRRVATLGWVSSEVAAEVARLLVKKFGAMRDSGMRPNGVERAVEILNLTTRATECNVIMSLDKTAPNLSEEIKRRMFVFEDITLLDPTLVRAVFAEAGEGDFLLALKQSAEKPRKEIIAALGNEIGQRIEAALAAMGRVRLSEAEAAAQRVVATVRRMEEEGRIWIERAGSD